MFLVKNLRKVSARGLHLKRKFCFYMIDRFCIAVRLRNALPSRRSFCTSQPLLSTKYDKAFEKFKLKQARMQCDDGLPVYLKGGTRDKILFNVIVALVLYNTFQSIRCLKEFVEKV